MWHARAQGCTTHLGSRTLSAGRLEHIGPLPLYYLIEMAEALKSYFILTTSRFSSLGQAVTERRKDAKRLPISKCALHILLSTDAEPGLFRL